LKKVKDKITELLKWENILLWIINIYVRKKL
jgi:hypothetical protein